ncbi:hypothetical protein GGR42_002686 [Saonia flava]|uniref:Uncharacterized protein n=1 Tax=Saonia flava TaxID=523696 RepID=A0A846R2M0_9FLAO|nr:DUF6544 family protein [Saonia flava]NJB72195.1 hypothetical protein [Saonia flava]
MILYLVLVIILGLVLIVFYGFYRFNAHVEKEKDFLFNIYDKKESTIKKEDLEGLPFIMKKYLEKVGVLGMCIDCNVTFKQSGRIKTDPLKKWTKFSAVQYIIAKHPGFIWNANAFPIFIRDKSIQGMAEVKVSFAGLKDIAIADGAKTDVSALGRYLGELIFYPIGFLSKNIKWEEMDENSVKAHISINNISTEGIFHFNEEGLIVSYEAQRYRDENLEYFTGIAENYKIMDELYIPSSMRAIWNLKEGDFEYFNCDVYSYKID